MRAGEKVTQRNKKKTQAELEEDSKQRKLEIKMPLTQSLRNMKEPTMTAQSIVAQELGPAVLCCTAWQSLATDGLCYDSAQTELNKNNVTHFRRKTLLTYKLKENTWLQLISIVLFPLPDILKLTV